MVRSNEAAYVTASSTTDDVSNFDRLRSPYGSREVDGSVVVQVQLRDLNDLVYKRIWAHEREILIVCVAEIVFR